MSTIEDIRDWVMAGDTPTTLMWHGLGVLDFTDGVHFYRMLDTHSVSVASIEGFERWGPSTKYYMGWLPYSKVSLMQLVEVCKYLSANVSTDPNKDALIDVGPLMEIFHPETR